MTGLATERGAPATAFLDPAVLARIGSLELLARTVVDGFVSGLHRSPHLGLSTDFAEHRAYMPGDDIRRVDWRLFGRTDRFYMKEFEAETNTNVSVLLDISRSMAFASGGAGALTKLDYARFLAASLAYFSSHQRDRVGLVTFDSDIVEFVPPSSRRLPVVLHAIDRIAAGRPGALERPLARIAEATTRRSILVLISDLYDEPSRILHAVDQLRTRGNDVIVMHLLDRAELDFPFDDAANFQDMESGERMPLVPTYLREQYRVLVAEHIAELGRLLGEHGIDYAFFDTSRPLDHALFEYLAGRQRLSRVR